MSDPSSPSTSSARDAVVEAMDASDAEHVWYHHSLACRCGFRVVRYEPESFDRHRQEMRLDAALGVTYTSPCPECDGKKIRLAMVQATDGFGNAHEVSVGVEPCPSCNGSGRSAPRLALIDVLVAQGVLVPTEKVSPVRADGIDDGKWWHCRLDEDAPPDAHVLYRIPSSKES